MTNTQPTELSVAPPALTARLDAQALWSAFRRRWLLASCLAIIGAVGAAGTTWLFMPTPKYTAQALIHVEAIPPNIMGVRADARNDFQSYQKTQIALVKSRLVLNAALRQPDVAELSLVREPLDPIGWLQKELLVDFTTAPEIMRIGLTGYPPEEMKILVGRITKSYLEDIVKREDNKRRDRFEKLKDIHDRYQETLRSKRRTLRELAENVGSGDPQTLVLKQRFAQEQLAQTEKELLQIDSDLRRLQTELALHKARGDSNEEIPLPESDLEEILRKDPVVDKLTAQKLHIQQDINEALRVAKRGENEPRIQAMRKTLAMTDTAIEQRRDQMRPIITSEWQGRLQRNLKANTEALAYRLSLLEELRKTLAKDANRLAVESRSLNKGSLDIESYKQDITQTEDTAKKVAAELESLSVELKATPRVTELESAAVTQPDDNKRRLLGASAAGFGGLLFFGLLVAWWENRCRRVQSADEIVHGLGIKLIGTVPSTVSPRSRTSKLLPATARPAWESLATDAMDATRAMLLHTARLHGTQVLMVTSAVAGEGKTSLASRLAASMARANRRTLLIDCDLRNPTAHRQFQLKDEPGISEAMMGSVMIEEIVQKTPINGLSLIASGRVTAEALQALTQEALSRILHSLREQYDFIVVDACPVLPVADALLIGQQVDGVILSVLHDVSQLHKIYAAYQLLGRMSVPILGAVLNGGRDAIHVPEYPYLQQAQPTVSAVTAE